jgi:hypothetical protein
VLLDSSQIPFRLDFKRTRRDELIGVVIHICMQTTQRKSLCSYLYLKVAKTSCFSFYLLWVFFYKIGEQEGGTGSVGEGVFGTGVSREVAGKGAGG